MCTPELKLGMGIARDDTPFVTDKFQCPAKFCTLRLGIHECTNTVLVNDVTRAGQIGLAGRVFVTIHQAENPLSGRGGEQTKESKGMAMQV